MCAPPSAQKRLSKLAKAERLGEGMFLLGKGRPKREARAPVKIEPTSAAPTPERAAKEPYGFLQQFHAGGQVSHQARVFTDVFDRHIRDDIREAFALLLRGFEIAHRARSTSSRAYTGAPYTGQSPDHDGHVALTDEDRRQLELFAAAWAEFTAQTPEWADRLKAHVLRVPDERSGRLQTVPELGASRTGYAVKSDNATAAGVMGVIDAGLRWMEAVQAGAMKLQYARMRRRAVYEQEAARYALGEQARRNRDVEAEKQARVLAHVKKIAGAKR